MSTKKTIQGASATEYVLRDVKQAGKQPHAYFSHSDKSVCAAKKSELYSKAHANGSELNLVMIERLVTYPDATEFPQGEESRTMKAEVTETEVE